MTEIRELLAREIGRLKNMDLMIVLPAVLLFFVGLVTIFSATAGKGGVSGTLVYRQVLWGIVALIVFFVVFCIGHERFFNWSVVLYGAVLLVLFLVFAMGTVTRGAHSWINVGRFLNIGAVNLQPSEGGKVALALILSTWLYRYPPVEMRRFLGSLALAAAGGGLVLLQPDLGTAIVYGAITIAALFAAGTPRKYLIGTALCGLFALPLGWTLLKEYQKLRLLVFLNPYLDPLGAGYNVIQSRIAVGAGGLLGKGFLQGTQSKLRFLPEPHTDFVFSVFAEEFGFIGAVIVIALFGLLLWRLISTGIRSKDVRAKILVAGITGWFWFQIVECIAMSMGLAPVTGLPLPFISYGGSALVSVSAALGLVQSIFASTRKQYR
ncbi:MAG: rod shape-determining protein RodA [Thermovirgaceae bacterium]